jgi:hypothetical protein
MTDECKVNFVTREQILVYKFPVGEDLHLYLQSLSCDMLLHV